MIYYLRDKCGLVKRQLGIRRRVRRVDGEKAQRMATQHRWKFPLSDGCRLPSKLSDPAAGCGDGPRLSSAFIRHHGRLFNLLAISVIANATDW